jgi:hypothetical protein
MSEEREHAAPEQEQGEPEETEGGVEPFDQNPPVNPSEPQVGNSRARFFMPREESGDSEDSEDDGSEEGEVREGNA